MTGTQDSMSKVALKSSAVNDEWQKVKATAAASFDSVKTRIERAKDSSDHTMIAWTRQTFKETYDYIDHYISTHPSSYVSAQLLMYYYDSEASPAESGPLFSMLDDSIKKSIGGIAFKRKLDADLLTDIGKKALDIELPDSTGHIIKLSSYQGRIVLLDFWASWCGPCRAANPGVRRAYMSYHDKGFDIYAVSLDISKTAWQNAIAKDSLPWTHVADLKGWKSPAAKLYGVKGIPMNILIDKNGTIIAKNLGEGALTKKLSEILK